MTATSIGGRIVGPGHPAFLVAEMSANHGHDLGRAATIIRAMKAAGADAVKLQTYTADTLTIDSDAPWFRIGPGSPWSGRTLYDLYREAHTPWEWHAELFQVARAEGLACFSTPFDETAVDFLESLEAPAYKIASFELVDVALIRRVAQTGKPVIMSTGMATLPEIEDAVATARAAGATQIVLLKCTSAYPSPPEAVNLLTLADLSRRFELPVGLSDHTMGTAVPVAAVALGACLIEKHFTLSRSDGGPDSGFSLEPDEFRAMADAIRTAEAALGGVQYGAGASEAGSQVFRRSLFVVRDMQAGELFSTENVRSIRPGYGLSPRHLGEVIGCAARRELSRGTPLEWTDIAPRGASVL